MATPNLKPDPSASLTDTSRANSAHTNSIIARAIHPEHDQQRVSHETRSLITFITLLLHALLLLLFAYLNPPERLPSIRSARKEAELIVMPNRPQAKPKPAPQPKPAPPLPTPAAKPEPEPLTLAARTARTSKFGMPLQDFDTEDINFDAQANKIQEAMPQKAPTSSPLPDQKAKTQEVKQKLESPVPAPEIAAPEKKQENTQTAKPEPLEKLLPADQVAKQVAQEKAQEVKQTRESLTNLRQANLAPKMDLPERVEVQKSEPEPRPEQTHTEPLPFLVPPMQAAHTAPQAKKQLPSLAQLARGYIHALEEKPGDSTLTVHGDKNKKPTAEQLKLERYVEKLVWQIQNSMRIHNDKHPRLNIPYHDRKNVISRIFLALNKNGSIRDVQLVSSCGISSLDNFYIFVFKDAGSSFPPVPSYLANADNFDVVLGVTL
jgi:hypothetical protein